MLKLGLIGCSGIAEKHLAALEHIDDISLTAVCDVNADVVEAVAKKHGCMAYTDYQKLLADTSIDAVSICTPSYLHAEMAIAAARAGKHVLTEKPMALTSEDAKQMIDAATEADVRLAVVFQNRCKPSVRMLRDALDAHRLGNVYFGKVTVFWTRPQDYFDQAPWRGSRAKNGGMLFNQASHHLDILQWYMGPVTAVKAMTDTVAHTIETDDITLALLKFASGAYCIVEATINTYPRNLEGSVTLMGTSGTVKLGGNMADTVEIWDLADATDIERATIETINRTAHAPHAWHEAIYRDFLDAVTSGRSPIVDGASGLRTIELIESIYSAA